MKSFTKYSFLLYSLFCFSPFCYAQNQISTDDNLLTLQDSLSASRIEERFKDFLDSLRAIHYNHVETHWNDSTPSIFISSSEEIKSSPFRDGGGTIVPTSVEIDRTKRAGQIPISSGVSPSGAKTYDIPIEVYPGMNGLQPKLSLSYNSQGGNSVLGMGWSIGGLSSIRRTGRSVYYDGITDAIKMNNKDGFTLDGVRLIRLDSVGSYILYESETGNIKVKGYVSGDVMRYFEVFYPTGEKGVFCTSGNSSNLLEYPLMSLMDLHGNTITYSYSYANNHFTISNISYNTDASVDFSYTETRPDTLMTYAGGVGLKELKLLENVVCKYNNRILHKYTLSYITQKGKSLLSTVGYTGRITSYSFNPLRFYYGEGLTATGYDIGTTQVNYWYSADSPAFIRHTTGRFSSDLTSEGLITWPNQHTYYRLEQSSSLFQHSINRYVNYYTGLEKLFLYTDLSGDWSMSNPYIYTGGGFIDVLCADIDGSGQDAVIQINNAVYYAPIELLAFTVYKRQGGSFSASYARSYPLATAFVDGDDYPSVQPKFYYTGDFNGDGRMEVLAVSASQPFGDLLHPSICYVFDLENNAILYQGHMLDYTVLFYGNTVQNSNLINLWTDRLFVMDYDGDGKSDLCHITASGMYVYTFDISSSGLSARLVSVSSDISLSFVYLKDVLPNDYNGDGLVDMLISPASTGGDTWTLLTSKGDGQFVNSTFTGPSKGSYDFAIQDVNHDGTADVIRYSDNDFSTYLMLDGQLSSCVNTTNYPDAGSIFTSTNLNSYNRSVCLMSEKGGKFRKYSFQRDDSKEVMATGMANSLGVIEKNTYCLMTEGSLNGRTVFQRGISGTFPYVNIQEPVALLAMKETYVDGSQVDFEMFDYFNAVVHRQGLGFCGFECQSRYDKRWNEYKQIYDPYNYGVMTIMTTPRDSVVCTYNFDIASNKIAKIQMTNMRKKDLLKGISTITSYTYDNYGYPTQENTTFTGGITVNRVNTYASNTTVGNGYNLGFLRDQTVTTTRGNSSFVQRTYFPVHNNKRQPIVRTDYKNGNQVANYIYTYDTHGNKTSESYKPYTSTNSLQTNYTYDSHGRLSTVTDPIGLTDTYSYNIIGKVDTIRHSQGGITKFTYDYFGREASHTNRQLIRTAKTYSWATGGMDRLLITTTETGKPTVSTTYDALGRETTTTDIRPDSLTRKIVKQYDEYGRLQRVSLPFKTGSASLWNTYAYDAFDRITSLTEASGRQSTYSYNGNSITTTADGIATTRTYDALGNVISVTDPAGTITYNLCADGQPSSVSAPGGITTTFGYDQYRRRTSISDPSLGQTTYEYDTSGNLKKETNANGMVIQHTYDTYGRLTQTTRPEFSTSYTYNTKGELTTVNNTNGTSKSFTYDTYGRLSTLRHDADSIWLKKEVHYNTGNVSYIYYTTNSGSLGIERFAYANGHRKELKYRGTVHYTLISENNLGLPTQVNTGYISRNYTYDTYGQPTGRNAIRYSQTIQDLSYTFNPQSGNMTSRTDNTRNITESFSYDGLNRLTAYTGNTATYDVKGNITGRSDVGSFNYGITQKPYAVSAITPASNHIIPSATQEIKYTSFHRPDSIEEGNRTAAFVYDENYERAKMTITANGASSTTYYLGGCYEVTVGNTPQERLYLGGDFYSAPYVCEQPSSSSRAVRYLLRDNQGSITHIVTTNGQVLQELSYDAWGRLRNPATQQVYACDSLPTLYLGRGYTGHEHLTGFNLINMNARLYDPALGRFLSPDPYVQAPENSQNFNRYSYCLNNPLRYTDKTGKFFLEGLTWGLLKGCAYKENPWKYAIQFLRNERDIIRGQFRLDGNKSSSGKFKELVSRFTWQMPQTAIGTSLALECNHWLNISDVDFLYGTVVLRSENGLKDSRGITMGNVIIGGRDIKADPTNDLFRHEYGHYLQSQKYGWAYIPRIAVPSYFSARKARDERDNSLHDYRSHERDANYRALFYFMQNYNLLIANSWNFESYPIYPVSISLDYNNPFTYYLLQQYKPLHTNWYQYVLGSMII